MQPDEMLGKGNRPLYQAYALQSGAGDDRPRKTWRQRPFGDQSPWAPLAAASAARATSAALWWARSASSAGLYSRSSLEEKENPRMWAATKAVMKQFEELTAAHGGINCCQIARVDWMDRDQVKDFYGNPESPQAALHQRGRRDRQGFGRVAGEGSFDHGGQGSGEKGRRNKRSRAGCKAVCSGCLFY